MVIAALVGVVGVFGLGLEVGRNSVMLTHTAVGQAQSSQYAISVKAGGWAYEIPVDVRWTDRSGGTHEGDRPPCLPPTGTVKRVRFEWTAYQAGPVGGRTVVNVDCP